MEISGDTIATVIGALGLGGILAAAINAVSNRKKTGADATKVLTDAALGIVTQLQGRIKDLLGEVQELKAREDERDAREDRTRQALLEHHDWDLALVRVINENLPEHADMLPPPPLFDELNKRPTIPAQTKDPKHE